MNTNPEHYKWGMFYFNPKDSRVFVPKIDQLRGWTVNFAHPFSYLVIMGIIVVIVFIGMY
jgi:uncharacterized membrane protein